MKIVVDLRTVFAAAQAYVMLSRVQSIEQLFILHSLPINKFYADTKALDDLERLNNISININPPIWEENVVENCFSKLSISAGENESHLRGWNYFKKSCDLFEWNLACFRWNQWKH